MIQGPRFEGKYSKSEETERRHLKKLEFLQPGNRVNPFPPRPEVVTLPDESDSGPSHHQSSDPSPFPTGDVADQREFRSVAVNEGIGDQERGAPDEREKHRRINKCKRARAHSDQHGCSQFPRTNPHWPRAPPSSHACRFQRSLRQDYSRHYGGKRQKNAHPALPAAVRHEHVVPVG